jgi:hypothetical protein
MVDQPYGSEDANHVEKIMVGFNTLKEDETFGRNAYQSAICGERRNCQGYTGLERTT